MALDFPSVPTNGQTFTGPDGTVWTWDGVKWVSGTGGSTGTAPINSPVFTGDPQAPTPPPNDNDTSIATTAFVQAAVAPALNNIGRNLLHNPLFNIAQRGNGPFTATSGVVYTADRWAINAQGGATGTAQILPNGITIGGDEAIEHQINHNFAGSATAGSQYTAAQSIEDVRRLSGKTVTLSFWATTNSGTLNLDVVLAQNFGTGGSPSSTVFTGAGVVTPNTTWQRFTQTFTLPSVSGKTLGTNNDHATQLIFVMTQTGQPIGVQSGTIGLAGVQLEVGPVASPLEKPDPRYDLANCQRFYQIIRLFTGSYMTAGQAYDVATSYLVSPRASPTLTSLVDSSGGMNARTLGSVEGGIYAQAQAATTGSNSINIIVGVSADL